MGSPPILIVSGGAGASAEQLLQTALAQFQTPDVTIVSIPAVRQADQIADAVARAASSGGLIVHTLVDASLRNLLIRLANDQHVAAIDLIGPLLMQLSTLLQEEPLGQPGRYRQLREDYFKRIDAIEFAVAHDDGQNPHEWPRADIVLVGVSRTGKTPLSMYLSMRGWKVANVPLVRHVPPAPELFLLDRRRVVGLTIDLTRLAAYRRWRERRLAMPLGAGYTDPSALEAEIEAARHVFRRGGFAVVDVTDKPIETSAAEVITLIGRPAG